MAIVPRPFPPAVPHGVLREVLPDLFFVTGEIRLAGVVPVRFSRNMTVVRQRDRLVLLNAMRLDDEGLAALDRLGRVTDVFRLAGNHGMDDPFYADRYGAKVWAVKGQRYTAGFNPKAADVYFAPQEEVDGASALPVEGARLYVIHATPPEALLLLPHHGGTLVAGDSLQNIVARDEYFNVVASLAMPLMGFIHPSNVGPVWWKECKPPRNEVRGILDLAFANVLPAHGTPVIGNARESYRPAIDRVCGKRP